MKKRDDQKERCPRCRKFRMVIKDKKRTNWPFGKKSKPIITIYERTKICKNLKCKYKSVTKFPPTFIR